jgi:hypothetical protein
MFLMKFYKLTHPEYSTDMQFSIANPVRIDSNHYLPDVYCPECGSTWGSSDRIRTTSAIAGEILRYLKTNNLSKPLPIDKWDNFARDLSLKFRLPINVIKPGAEFGPPVGLIRNSSKNHIVHPFPGVLWVSNEVVSAFKNEGLTGIEYWNVSLKWAEKKPGLTEPLPKLTEIFVTEQVWRIGMDVARITACNRCKRSEFPQPKMLKIDEARWTGTDFMNPDTNPNIVIVSERVYNVLNRYRFINYSCIEV